MLMERAALADRFGWLNTSDLTLGAFGRSGEGWFDAHSLLALMRNAARSKGARYIDGEVVGVTPRLAAAPAAKESGTSDKPAATTSTSSKGVRWWT